MLTPEENRRLTQVGPGTPMGEVFRRYWLPFALVDELPEPDGAPLRVRLLGEDLIAFHASDGEIGLVDSYCPHRRAPMFFGRNEAGGLRCVYHGWKFDRSGACIDMPSEPPDSLFKTKVGINAYPTWRAGGMVWAYLGPPEQQPPPPDYELLRAPAHQRHVAKTYEACNYLQALEGGLDTAHISFLHWGIVPAKRANGDDGKPKGPRTSDTAPRLEVELTDYGYRYAGVRQYEDRQYVKAYHYVMPAQQFRGQVIGPDGRPAAVGTLHGHIWVPIDDEHTFDYNWMLAYDPAKPLTPELIESTERKAGRGPGEIGPGFVPKNNRDNDYGIDRQRQKTETFTGIAGVNTQDLALQEGMGPIIDRSKEHLGTVDRAIIAARQLLLEATTHVAEGKAPRGADPATYRDVRAVDLYVPKGLRWQDELKEELLAKF